MAETQVGRILRLLPVSFRMLGLSSREVERRLGWTPGYMNRILTGLIELRVEHLVDIAGAMGLKPRELLLFAFPDRGQPPTEAALDLDALVDEIRPAKIPKPKPAGITEEELNRRIEAAMIRFFARLSGGPEA